MLDSLIFLLARRRTLFFPIAAILVFVFGHPTWGSFATGMALVACGEAIRVWASGYLRKDLDICSGGPFSSMRNPLYAGSFLIAAGFGVVSDRWVVLAGAVTLFCLLHAAAIAYEETYLADEFGDRFRDYCRKVPRLIPKWPRSGEQGYSFRLALRNGEHVSAFYTGLVALAFALRILIEHR